MNLQTIRHVVTPIRLVIGMFTILVLLIFSGVSFSAPMIAVTVLGLLGTLAAMIVSSLWRFSQRQTAMAPAAASPTEVAGPVRGDGRYGALLIAHLAVAGVFALSAFFLLGLPGLLVYLLASPVVDAVLGARALDRLPGYGGLAIGVWVSLIWPWALPAAYLLGRGFPVRPRLNAPLYLGVLYGWAVAASFLAHMIVRLLR